MSKLPLVSLTNVGKNYPIINTAGSRLRTIWSLLTGSAQYEHFPALNGIDLDVLPGQSLGLIGENGAGKSTLLKIIAGVVKATTGQVTVNARISALLELGAGFHPDYTGRENIYLATALMGLSRPETQVKLDSIISFADIGDHIDQPIKNYSSGMIVRLGFAVATSLNPEILITDEVLAVGDESFQKKCINWMESYLNGGGTMLLCSHSMFHIQKLCNKALWIHQGKTHLFGDSREITREYLAYHEEKAAKAHRSGQEPAEIQANVHGDYAIKELWLENNNQLETNTIGMKQDVILCGRIYSADDRPPVIGMGVIKLDGVAVFGTVSDIGNFQPDRVKKNIYGFRLRFKSIKLLPGKYYFRAHSMDPEGVRLFNTVEVSLKVTGKTRDLGFCSLDCAWEASNGRLTDR